jgi:Domain of unknown function (DUF4159)
MKSSGRRLICVLIVILGVVGAGITAAHAQRIWAGFYGRTPPRFPTATTYDGSFNFCRVLFASDRREKQGWSTDYLLKGGFLLVSDYHGTLAKEQFDEEIGRALPRSQFPVVDLTPPDHALWRMMFPVSRLPQMASIQTWRRTGGDTIERWNEDGSPPNVRGITDANGRLMVVMVHNTDLPDGWEREGEDPDYFFRFSPEAYAVTIDIVLYSMTH